MVRAEDCWHAGFESTSSQRNFFFLKIQETYTLTTFVEQKLSLSVKKLKKFHASVRE